MATSPSATTGSVQTLQRRWEDALNPTRLAERARTPQRNTQAHRTLDEPKPSALPFPKDGPFSPPPSHGDHGRGPAAPLAERFMGYIAMLGVTCSTPCLAK